MAAVYILYSQQANKFYTGSCLDLDIRLKEHRDKNYKQSFTSRYEDWELYLVIDDLSYNQARAVENHIKKMKSSTYIQNLLKHEEMIGRLKVKYQGAGSSR